MQTIVKKWFKDKESGFLDNGAGPDIMVHKTDLVGCQFLKAGVAVEFECHLGKGGLVAKRVMLSNRKQTNSQNNGKGKSKEFRFGVMT